MVVHSYWSTCLIQCVVLSKVKIFQIDFKMDLKWPWDKKTKKTKTLPLPDSGRRHNPLPPYLPPGLAHFSLALGPIFFFPGPADPVAQTPRHPLGPCCSDGPAGACPAPSRFPIPFLSLTSLAHPSVARSLLLPWDVIEQDSGRHRHRVFPGIFFPIRQSSSYKARGSSR